MSFSSKTVAGVLALGILVGGPVSTFAAEQEEINELREQLLILQRRLEQLEASETGEQPPPAAQQQERRPQQTQRNPVRGQDNIVPAQGQAQQSTPEDEPVRDAGPSRSTEDIASQEHVFFGGNRFTIEPGISYSRFDRGQLQLSGFLALDSIFLGQISVDEVESDIITADITGRWNVTDRIQVNANVPFVYRTSQFSSGGAGGAAPQTIAARVTEDPNIGDISGGVSVRVLNETPSRPDVVLSVSGRAPTGTSPFGIETNEVPGSQGNLDIPDELPTGSGVYAGTAGVSVLKTFDPLLFFGNLSYTRNFRKSFDDLSAAAGDQPGEFDLGDSITVGAGAAIALNERTSLSMSYSHSFVQASQEKPDGGSFEEVIGSDASVGVLNLGFTFALSDNLSVVTNLGAGLTEDASDVTFGVRFPYSF